MEVDEQSRLLPGMASPAADGYGYALALPTLLSMLPMRQPNLDGEEGDASMSGFLTSPERPGEEGRGKDESRRSSVAMDMNNFGGEMPPTLANLFPNMEGGGPQSKCIGVCVGVYAYV